MSARCDAFQLSENGAWRMDVCQSVLVYLVVFDYFVCFFVFGMICVSQGCITDILEENVIQPLLVNLSALGLATECVRMILKIDDIVAVR
jgi:hypothetical protein